MEESGKSNHDGRLPTPSNIPLRFRDTDLRFPKPRRKKLRENAPTFPSVFAAGWKVSSTKLTEICNIIMPGIRRPSGVSNNNVDTIKRWPASVYFHCAGNRTVVAPLSRALCQASCDPD